MKTLSAPFNICLGITNKCNLNCKHCLASGTRDSQDLTTEELLNIIQQIKELKIFDLAIFGGEPLMRKDFFTIVDALSGLKLNLSLNTNGTLITADIAKRLAQYSIKTYTVSLDGSCKEVQDPFRGKGSFDKTIKGIQNLIAEKRNVLISTTVTRLNYNDAERIVLLGKRLGARQVRFNEVMYVGNAACYHQGLIMTPKEKFALLDKAKALKNTFDGFVTGAIFQIADIMEEMRRNPKEVFPLRIHSCGAAVRKCAIRPDGWVTPCEVLWEIRAGNLKKEKLRDIWHNSPIMRAFRETIEIKEEEILECNGCEYIRLCYKGHRCQPYYYPGAKFEHKELYCWREDVVGAR
jgi:SynChlorMet cassette radical SAM/SPASM protein ScmE